MFHKPFHIKSQTVLKGSDRKKIRAQILSQSPLFSSEILSEIIPQKSDVQQARVQLHNGEPAVIILSGKQPVFFEFACIYYPTVYTLWNYPDQAYLFSTWQPVISKLYSGADLMLPGVVMRSTVTLDTFSHITAALPVAVNAVGNRAALAVGETCMSGESMYKSGMRGKGVAIRHFYGDHLWAMGSKVTPPKVDEIIPPNTESDYVVEELESGTEALDLCNERHEGKAEESSPSEVAVEGAEGHGDNAGDPTCTTDTGDKESTLNDLTEDDKLYQCFLYALKKKVKKTQLPMLTSGFFRDCVQVCCPPGTSLDLKKTRYKKLMPFLLEMQTEGFLVVKETAKGVHSVIDFNPAHDEVRYFKPWELPVVEDTGPDETQEYVYEPPQIVELLAVNSQTHPLFSQLGLSKGDTLNMSRVRSLVTDYVKNKNLQHTENKQLVILDEALTKVLITKKDGYVEHLRWPIIFERLSRALGTVYEITYSNGAVTIKKGVPPPIQVKLETRTGNKKVTLINNLDKFGIDVKMIAKELRSTKACSTSIQDHTAGPQVLAQGNHASFVHKLLKDRYRIPIKYLDIPK